MDEVIIKAKDGCEKSIEKIIDVVLDQPYINGWVYKYARIIKLWDLEDIISEMRIAIWELIKENDLSSFDEIKKLFQFKMKQVFYNQIIYEKRDKRKGEVLKFNEGYMFANNRNYDFMLDVEKVMEKGDEEFNFIIRKICEGYSIRRISFMMNDCFDGKWYSGKILNKLRKGFDEFCKCDS